MEASDSHSLNWKTCFKKILAPHLLNPSDNEEQNIQFDAPDRILNPVNGNQNFFTFPNDYERSKGVKKDLALPVTKASVQTDKNSQPFFHDFPYGNLNDLENPTETEEEIASIITAHAEELAKSFKVTKNKKHFNKTERRRSVPDWNTALKKVFSPEPEHETVKVPNFDDSPYSEMTDPSIFNRWTFHRLSREDFQQS